MNYQDKSGVLFRNEHKKTEKHPDYSGKCQIAGVIYRIAGWKREGTNGSASFLKLAFTEFEDQAPKPEWSKPTPPSDADDDVPF